MQFNCQIGERSNCIRVLLMSKISSVILPQEMTFFFFFILVELILERQLMDSLVTLVVEEKIIHAIDELRHKRLVNVMFCSNTE